MGTKRVAAFDRKQKKEAAFDRFKKELGDEYGCFVLIACTTPSQDGKMEVEMDYEGDETLAAFLVENASQVFEGRHLTRETK
jgi:hypothetical protein